MMSNWGINPNCGGLQTNAQIQPVRELNPTALLIR